MGCSGSPFAEVLEGVFSSIMIGKLKIPLSFFEILGRDSGFLCEKVFRLVYPL